MLSVIFRSIKQSSFWQTAFPRPAKNLAILKLPLEQRKGFTVYIGKETAISSIDVIPTSKPLSFKVDLSIPE